MALQINVGSKRRPLLPVLSLLALLAFFQGQAGAEIKGTFAYSLSNLTGAVPYSTPRLTVDRERGEISVLYQNSVSVFNESGMEIYSFGSEIGPGHLVDLAVEQAGDILILRYLPAGPGKTEWEIVRCNFRGEPTGRIAFKNLPAEFSGFSPNRLICRGGNLYLADLNRLKVVVLDAEGNFKSGHDLVPLLGLAEKDRDNMEIRGFSVADDGTILFTIPVLFSAYVLSLDGQIASFGRPGGAPGRFNIVGGIVSDGRGNYLVLDRLKCAVQVFDKDFKYLTQFGQRGWKKGELIAPDDIAIDKAGRVYVTQNGKKGVSVFRITYN